VDCHFFSRSYCVIVKNNIHVMVEKIFPVVLYYLLFVDTLGFSIHAYHYSKKVADIDLHKDFFMWFDPVMMGLDCLLVLIYFCVGNHGLTNDPWNDLENIFPNHEEQFEKLKNFLNASDWITVKISPIDSQPGLLIKNAVKKHLDLIRIEDLPSASTTPSILVVRELGRHGPTISASDGIFCIAKDDKLLTQLNNPKTWGFIVIICDSLVDFEASEIKKLFPKKAFVNKEIENKKDVNKGIAEKKKQERDEKVKKEKEKAREIGEDEGKLEYIYLIKS